jgi:hypothetical protein
MKPIMTATRPVAMPAISLLPEALPFVAVAEADEAVADAVGELPAAVPAAVAPEVIRTWLIVGSLALGSTSQPPAVEAGQAGGVTLGVYSELGVPVGVRVFH